MINYELAKKLKDAGYPLHPDCFSVNPVSLEDTYHPELAPTLSELIEACGDCFRNLTWHYTSQEWTSCGIPKETRGKLAKEWKNKKKMCGGSTPEIAVAKLWLKLNANGVV